MMTTSERAVLSLVLGALVSVGCVECAPAEAALARPESFVVEPLRCGEQMRAEVLVKNRRPQSCSVVTWRTSCDCLSIEPARLALEPAEATRLTCALDFSDDPDFAGDLGIQVEGFDAIGSVILAFELRVSVRKP
jgi:hypothetical protein